MPSHPFSWEAVFSAVAGQAGIGQTPFFANESGSVPAPLLSLSITAYSSTQLVSVSFTPAPIGADLALALHALVPENSPVPPGRPAFLLLSISNVNINSPWPTAFPFSFSTGTLRAGQTLAATIRTFSMSHHRFGPATYATCTVL
jgi:hypothetical protein